MFWIIDNGINHGYLGYIFVDFEFNVVQQVMVVPLFKKNVNKKTITGKNCFCPILYLHQHNLFIVFAKTNFPVILSFVIKKNMFNTYLNLNYSYFVID